MNIRKVVLKDFKELYKLGLNIPELKVSSTEDFMDEDEFKFCIKNKYLRIIVIYYIIFLLIILIL